MKAKPRIYEHPSIITSCANCQSIRSKSKNKELVSLRCSRYKNTVNVREAINGKYPNFCKLYGSNGIDRERIYPDPIKVFCCANCPANRRDPAWNGEIPITYRCFEYDQPLTLEDFKNALDGKFPSFCKLKEA
jgi:hypothetical protein